MRVFFCGVGSKRPVGINIEKAWNLTFAYSLVRGFCKTLPTRISKQRPRRYVHRCRTQRIKHTMGHLPLSYFGHVKFCRISEFQNKRQ